MDVRPWIIVVEATAVLSEVQTHASWEHLLTDRGYSFVYFDGLNRFYVAEEHPELVRSFQSPPNVFDDWMRVGDRRAHDKANVLSARLLEEQEAHKAQLDAFKAQLDTSRLSRRLTKHSSTLSWKPSRPSSKPSWKPKRLSWKPTGPGSWTPSGRPQGRDGCREGPGR